MGTPSSTGSVAARLGHRGPGPVRLLDADLEVPPVLGKDRVRQRVGTRGPCPRWRRRSRASSGWTRSARRSPRRAFRRRARPRHIPRPHAGRAGAGTGATLPGDGNLRQRHQVASESTGALDAAELAQAYSFDPLYSSSHYGAGTHRRAGRDVGSRATRRVTSHTSPTATASRSATGRSRQKSVGGGGRHRSRHGGGRARHRDRALPGAQGEHRGLRRRSLGQPLRRLQPDRQRRHGEDRQRELDERLRGLRRPGAPELGEHPLPGGGRRRAVDLRRHRGPGVGGLQHQRGDLGVDGFRTRWRRRSTPRRGPSTSPTSRATPSAWTAREARAIRPTSRPRARSRPGPAPTPSRSTRRRGRSSWRTRGAR